MNYDEHEETGGPGPIASQDWFENNLRRVLKVVPKEKIDLRHRQLRLQLDHVAAGQGTPEPKVLDTDDITVQDGWEAAADANADLRLAGDELNPHFVYDDEDKHVRHQVWMLDAVTTLNELRAARQMGLQTFALWRLGMEDPSLWAIWDHPSNIGGAATAQADTARAPMSTTMATATSCASPANLTPARAPSTWTRTTGP